MEFGKNVFSVKDLVYVDQFGKTRLDHVSFTIKEGQILGIAGIDGNGQSELVEAIVGTLKQQQGTITMNGKDISNAPVLARQEAGISHVFRGPYEIRHGSEAFPGGQRDLQGLLYRQIKDPRTPGQQKDQ